MVPSYITALLDYDNVAMRFVGRGDTVPALPNVLDVCIASILSHIPLVETIDVRLYGGWLDEYGYFSNPAQRLLPELRHFRGRRGSTRFITSLALSLRAAPDCRLIGTVRTSTTRQRQKMIDGMLMLDVLHAVADRSAVAIASDDDDLVPAALLAARSAAEVYWFRARGRGSCNDPLLVAAGVRFLPLT